MTPARRSRLPARRVVLALLIACLAWQLPPAQASNPLPPRLQIGASLLPAIAAANQSLSTSNPNISLPVYVVYRDDYHRAEQLVPLLAQVGTIRNHPVAVSAITLDELLALAPTPMSVVFIAERRDSDIDRLIAFGRERRLLLFSPFKGDVERGVAAGFRVTDRVLPMVNMGYLKAANIQLKAFFLRIAVKHE